MRRLSQHVSKEAFGAVPEKLSSSPCDTIVGDLKKETHIVKSFSDSEHTVVGSSNTIFPSAMGLRAPFFFSRQLARKLKP